jgi:hypothetical protein
MRLNDDGKTVAAMDILAPGIGEIVGGSQREERLDVPRRAHATRWACDKADYWWYRDLRRYGNGAPRRLRPRLRARDHLRDGHGEHPRCDSVPARAGTAAF